MISHQPLDRRPPSFATSNLTSPYCFVLSHRVSTSRFATSSMVMRVFANSIIPLSCLCHAYVMRTTPTEYRIQKSRTAPTALHRVVLPQALPLSSHPCISQPQPRLPRHCLHCLQQLRRNLELTGLLSFPSSYSFRFRFSSSARQLPALQRRLSRVIATVHGE